MVETSRDWFKNLSSTLRAFSTYFHTFTRATPCSLVYGVEVMLSIKIEIGLLRVALEHQIFKIEWAQARFDQLSLLDERRLRAIYHIHAYQKKMGHDFKKQVKLRLLQRGDFVLRVLQGLVGDPREKFKPCGSGPYITRKLTS